MTDYSPLRSPLEEFGVNEYGSMGLGSRSVSRDPDSIRSDRKRDRISQIFEACNASAERKAPCNADRSRRALALDMPAELMPGAAPRAPPRTTPSKAAAPSAATPSSAAPSTPEDILAEVRKIHRAGCNVGRDPAAREQAAAVMREVRRSHAPGPNLPR